MRPPPPPAPPAWGGAGGSLACRIWYLGGDPAPPFSVRGGGPGARCRTPEPPLLPALHQPPGSAPPRAARAAARSWAEPPPGPRSAADGIFHSPPRRGLPPAPPPPRAAHFGPAPPLFGPSHVPAGYAVGKMAAAMKTGLGRLGLRVWWQVGPGSGVRRDGGERAEELRDKGCEESGTREYGEGPGTGRATSSGVRCTAALRLGGVEGNKSRCW